MARQDVNFGFTSTGADGLARDFRKVGDTATLAAKGARLCADELRAEERASKTAADALAKAERVSALLAVTEHELDKEIDKANRSLLEQGAAGVVAGKGAKEAGGGFTSLAGGGGLGGGGLAAVIAGGVALAPVIATLSVGLAGLGAAAISTVKPILEAGTATKQARAALASLDPAQRAAYDSLGKLKAQFAGFGKSLEPQVLDLFNRGLRIASGLMGDVAPVARAVGTALGGMLTAVDKEFRSGTWQKFFGFMAANAAPDVKLVSDAFIAWLNALPPLLENLQGASNVLLTLTTRAGQLTGVLANAANNADKFGSAGQTTHSWWQKALNTVTGWVELRNAWDTSAKSSDKAAKAAAAHAKAITDAATAATAAGPPTGLLADNLFVEKTNAADAASAVNDLNTAWSTFLGMSTSLETAQLGIIGTLKTLTGQAGKAGASFRGVNDQSVALQQTFESSLVPSVQNVIGSMRTAHATTHALAQVVATDLKPAIDAGALSSKAFKNQLFDLAVQAGYTGPNQLKPLRDWFDRNATSAAAAKGEVDKYAAALAALPTKPKTIHIAESGVGKFTISGPAGAALHPGFATGGLVRLGSGPVADDVPAMLSRGEVVVPARMVSAGAVDHLRGALPGFAGGGAVSSYKGSVGGLGPWTTQADQVFTATMTNAMTTAMTAATKQAMQQAFDPFAGITGVPSGAKISGSAAAAMKFAQSILWAYGWGQNQFPPLRNLWMGESGWNYRAYNASSGATGIPQSLPGSKMASAGADWRTNPATQIRWGLGYIKSVYGSPAAAYSRWLGRSPHWYSEGGLIPGYASGGSVAQRGQTWLNAWRSRHGGGYGAAHGPVVLNEQIPEMTAAISRARTLSKAGGLSAGQHRFWAGAAADETRRLAVLKTELTTERAWRTQLAGTDAGLARVIGAAGTLPSLAGNVRSWKAQMAAHQYTIGQISGMLGYSDAYIKAHKPPPTGVQATHSYGGDVANTIGTVLASALGPFTGARAGGLVMDTGGTLRPGWQPVYNGLGRPETLVPARGGGTVRLEVSSGGSSAFDQFLVTMIRKYVKVRGGGDVQAAFGAH